MYILECLFGFLTGIYSHNILSNYMLIGIEGVKYYKEAHLSVWNTTIHALIMPYTIYGMLIWIPGLLRLNSINSRKLNYYLYFLWGGHYFIISKIGGLIYFLNYFYSVKYANTYIITFYEKNKLKKNVHNLLVIKGLLISFGGLLFQEIIGHYIGKDINSRLEGIPNAIIYAMYFSSNNFLIQ